MNEAENGRQGWDDSEHLVHPHLLPLSALELPIAVCLITASPGIRMKVGLRAGGKGVLVQYWMFGGLGRIHGRGPLKKKSYLKIERLK